MAIKFEEKDGDDRPVKKPTLPKTQVSDEPTPAPSDTPGELPFGKPVKAEKKGRRK